MKTRTKNEDMDEKTMNVTLLAMWTRTKNQTKSGVTFS